MHLWIERVASDDNISDGPSREQYNLVKSLSAQWREPVIASMFLG